MQHATATSAARPAKLARVPARALDAACVVALAVVLRLIAGVGFVNYDTLYALAWGGQLAHGHTPAYEVPIAPTPHPLLELLGLILSPLGPGTTRDVTVALAFGALALCAWVIHRLGASWFSRAAGAIAALLFLTRVPVLSYGVRAYVDIPYVLLVLAALLVESEARRRGPTAAGVRRTGGARVLALLALAGLLRPEAWAFTALYWCYEMGLCPRRLLPPGSPPARSRGELARLTALAASAPVVWLASDLLVTGNPLWSLKNTRHTASELGRVTGIANVPEYVPRRIGEILQAPVLLAAALGAALSLLWLRGRALLGACAGAIAVLVLAAFATAGLPINTRYAFLAAAVLCVFAGAGVAGWANLPRGDRRRTWWLGAAALALIALLAYAPSQYRSAHRELSKLARQQSIEGDLLALVHDGAIALRCGPVGVPNHAPIPLLALYLKTSPARIVSAQVGHIEKGLYVEPASREVERDYVLDPRDPHVPVGVPPGFHERATSRSWLVFERCGQPPPVRVG